MADFAPDHNPYALATDANGMCRISFKAEAASDLAREYVLILRDEYADSEVVRQTIKVPKGISWKKHASICARSVMTQAINRLK